jgi:hypothetical protein
MQEKKVGFFRSGGILLFLFFLGILDLKRSRKLSRIKDTFMRDDSGAAAPPLWHPAEDIRGNTWIVEVGIPPAALPGGEGEPGPQGFLAEG